MADVEVAVVGAGVTGLAAARAIAEAGYSTCLLERHPRPGMDTSTHNSGVIHAGLYYPIGSLKAQFCVEGARASTRSARQHDIPHVRSGKLIVARRSPTCPPGSSLLASGSANGVRGWRSSGPTFVRQREPHVQRPPPSGRLRAASGSGGARSRLAALCDDAGVMRS